MPIPLFFCLEISKIICLIMSLVCSLLKKQQTPTIVMKAPEGAQPAYTSENTLSMPEESNKADLQPPPLSHIHERLLFLLTCSFWNRSGLCYLIFLPGGCQKHELEKPEEQLFPHTFSRCNSQFTSYIFLRLECYHL